MSNNGNTIGGVSLYLIGTTLFFLVGYGLGYTVQPEPKQTNCHGNLTEQIAPDHYTNTYELLNQAGPVTIVAKSWEAELPEPLQYQVTVRDTLGTYYLCYCADLYQSYEINEIVQ